MDETALVAELGWAFRMAHAPSQRMGGAVNSVESPRAVTGLSPELAGTVRTIFSEHDINSGLLLQNVRAALQCFSWTCYRVVGYLYVHWPRDTSIAFSHIFSTMYRCSCPVRRTSL